MMNIWLLGCIEIDFVLYSVFTGTHLFFPARSSSFLSLRSAPQLRSCSHKIAHPLQKCAKITVSQHSAAVNWAITH